MQKVDLALQISLGLMKFTAGPSSAYPTFRRPASICFSEPNEVFVPGLILVTSARVVLLDCASAEPGMPKWAAAIVMAAAPRKRRRFWLISSDIYFPPIGRNLKSEIIRNPES